eukprot:TRINITY_DN14152_c0_g2_i1.p1 TRINITY_DN14152_c0_g2~~TRINITY_DN14152_c0_g2_i1.p1  ORF type:complete len:195 (-),score=15.59 TRINITY_DN14152_c0_g2_i1:278-862(-)
MMGQSSSFPSDPSNVVRYGLQPYLTMLTILISFLAICYPFGMGLAKWWQGGLIVYISHLLLWILILVAAVCLYPRVLEWDAEKEEYRYIVMAVGVRVRLEDIEEMDFSWIPGYLMMRAMTLPFPLHFRPAIGQEIFLRDHASYVQQVQRRRQIRTSSSSKHQLHDVGYSSKQLSPDAAYSYKKGSMVYSNAPQP